MYGVYHIYKYIKRKIQKMAVKNHPCVSIPNFLEKKTIRNLTTKTKYKLSLPFIRIYRIDKISN